MYLAQLCPVHAHARSLWCLCVLRFLEESDSARFTNFFFASGAFAGSSPSVTQ